MASVRAQHLGVQLPRAPFWDLSTRQSALLLESDSKPQSPVRGRSPRITVAPDELRHGGRVFLRGSVRPAPISAARSVVRGEGRAWLLGLSAGSGRRS